MWIFQWKYEVWFKSKLRRFSTWGDVPLWLCWKHFFGYSLKHQLQCTINNHRYMQDLHICKNSQNVLYVFFKIIQWIIFHKWEKILKEKKKEKKIDVKNIFEKCNYIAPQFHQMEWYLCIEHVVYVFFLFLVCLTV